MTEHKEPKILVFDIETMANKAYVWGKYEQNVLSVDQGWYMLSFGYKWLGDKRSKVATLRDFKTFKKDKTDDKELTALLWDLFDQADIVIGHNSDRFDIKKANARFAFHGMNPPKPYSSIDTLKVARKYFKFDSNKLDDLGEYLNLGRKVKHEGWDLWLGCAVRNDTKSWKKMIEYNKQDVDLLEKIYVQLRPWMNNHPNMNVYTDFINHCPICGSEHVQRRGFRITRTNKYQRFHCQDCGGWSSKPLTRMLR